MSELVGLSGYARTGKDAVAVVLAHQGYVRVAFADPIRDVLLATDPIVYIDCFGNPVRVSAMVTGHGWDDAKAHPEVRRLLADLGVAMREAQPGVWLGIAMRKVEALLAAGHRVVITDVRFPDEAAAICSTTLHRRDPGRVWRVNRHGYGPINGHASETALDAHHFDWHIWNTGTLDALREQVLQAVG